MEKIGAFREKFKRNEKTEKFSAEKMFQMIEVANSSSDLQTTSLSEDGELKNITPNKNLEFALRQTGRHCIDYKKRADKETICRNALITALLTSTSLPVISFIENTNKTDGMIIGCSTSFLILSTAVPAFLGKFLDANTVASKAEKKLKAEFMALSLSQDYVNKHFSKIVRTFKKRETLLTKVESKEWTKKLKENAKEQTTIDQDNAVIEARNKLGLNNTEPQTLHDLISGNSNQNSHPS